MQIHQAGRATGKTTQLLRWLKFHPDGVLVVHSGAERDRLLKMVGKDALEVDRIYEAERRICTVQGALDGKIRGTHPRPVIAIDNLDLILPYIFGGSIGPITMAPTLTIIQEDGNDW